MLETHQTTLESLRIGFTVTPFCFSHARPHIPGQAYITHWHGRTGFGLHYGLIPDFRNYQNLKHLHLSSVFAAHGTFCRWKKLWGTRKQLEEFRKDVRKEWSYLQKIPPELRELLKKQLQSHYPGTWKDLQKRIPETWGDLQEARFKRWKGLQKYLDKLLPAKLTRLTFDVGCESVLRHCPVIRDGQETCNLLCPLDHDLWSFLIDLARRARKKPSPMSHIHVNYAIRPFALSGPAKDLPSMGFNTWALDSRWTTILNPWQYLDTLKRHIERYGVLFTYTCLEVHCGVPRTDVRPPTIPECAEVNEAERLYREYLERKFLYEDEMCSEHIWTEVKEWENSSLNQFGWYRPQWM